MNETAIPHMPVRRPSFRSSLLGALRLAAALAVTALVAAFVTIRLTARGSTVVVPSLTGMDGKQVRQALRDKGLEMMITSEEWNEQHPAGTVISQQPAAGNRVKRGRRVKLALSRGSEIIQVPELTQMRASEAEFLLRQIGLEMAGIASVPSPAPGKTILAHDPPAGTKVSRGRPVMLLASDGPAPATFAVPRVTGLPAREALSRLRTAGLNIAEVTYETTTLFAEGTVMAQSPYGGFRAVKGDEVRLHAARGASTGKARWVSFTYRVPEGAARRVRVVIVDEGGSREIANDIAEGGSVLRFPIRVQGEAIAQFFSGGTLIEERNL